eukprot:COSAG05_NODE_1557_length_4564_cov_116.713102_1_plen_102_part_00
MRQKLSACAHHACIEGIHPGASASLEPCAVDGPDHPGGKSESAHVYHLTAFGVGTRAAATPSTTAGGWVSLLERCEVAKKEAGKGSPLSTADTCESIVASF